MTAADDPESRILESYRAQNAAMIAGDLDRLDALLDEGYIAVHISGYRQTKNEWLEQISIGRMQYHSITEESASVTVEGATATLVATALVDATIYGSRASRPLRSVTTYAATANGWKASRSEATVS